MSKPISRHGARQSHVSRAVAEAHRHHTTAPFFGCTLCVRSTSFSGVALRWSSPRLG
jgi:hypothetical protein